ncbi:MAG: efflux RND transporter periplasmic adaptor subunit [Gemmatimonadota bacterium]
MKGRIAGLQTRFRSAILMATVVVIGGSLAAWKIASAESAEAAAASQPEPVEVVTAAVATERTHVSTTTSIGTVLATRSVSLRNEVAGTVSRVRLVPGQIVEAGTVLVALDVSVEQAELEALRARAELARTTLARYERMAEQQAISAIDLDNARAERDIAVAEVERLRAIIERKTIRAPFRARVGIADVHPGQFLEAGTLLTTLQGVDDAVHVDFAVPQFVAARLNAGDLVEVIAGQDEGSPIPARITATDARVDPTTRNTTVRVRIEDAGARLTPGASVRVRVPVGVEREAVVVPVSALRRGPAGDHVFALEPAEEGRTRAHVRQVQTGPVLGDEVVIVAGLEPGEQVAASGSFKLREGVLVIVSNGGSAAAGAGAKG